MTLPRFALLIALLGSLALTLSIIIAPWDALYAHIAPGHRAEAILRELPYVPPIHGEGCLGTPRSTLAWQYLERAPDGAARFQRVLASGSAAGRIYARAGLLARAVMLPPGVEHALVTDTSLVYHAFTSASGTTARVGALMESTQSATLASALRTARVIRATCWD